MRGSWGIAASRTPGGNNVGSYANPVFDAYVDSAVNSFDLARRRQYFNKAYTTIIQDAPAVWLAEPRQVIGYHSRLQVANMRSDAWWAHISDWWIPADKRIARDGIPASPAATAAAAPAPATSAPAPAPSAGKKTP